MEQDVTRHPHRTRRGAHRGARSAAAALIPSLLAVLAVSSLITALAVWQGEQPPQPGAAAAQRAATGAGGLDRAAVSSAPTTTAAPTPSATSTPTPTATAAPAPGQLRGTREVVVLNQTSRAGLAAEVAAALRDRGWTVPAVGNFRGVVPATTVYYPDGAEEVASVLAADLPTEPRLRPRFGNLSTGRLTIVVTDSYPG